MYTEILPLQLSLSQLIQTILPNMNEQQLDILPAE